MKSVSFDYVGKAKSLKILTNTRNITCVQVTGLKNPNLRSLGLIKADFTLTKDSLVSLGQCNKLKSDKKLKANLIINEISIPASSRISLDYNPNPKNCSIFIGLESSKKSKASLIISQQDQKNLSIQVENVLSNGKLVSRNLPSITSFAKANLFLSFPASSIRLNFDKNLEYSDDWFQSEAQVENFQFKETEQTLNDGKNLSRIILGSLQLDGKDSPLIIPEEFNLTINGGAVSQLNSLKIDREENKDKQNGKEGLRVKIHGKATSVQVGSQREVSVSRLDLLPDRLVSILLSTIGALVFGIAGALLTEGIKKWWES